AQLTVVVPTTEYGSIGNVSHHVPEGVAGSIANDRRIAENSLISPRPCENTSAAGTGSAVYSSSALMVFGVRRSENLWRLTSIIKATTPLVTAADMLVPFRRRYRAEPSAPATCREGNALNSVLFNAAGAIIACPDAAMSGLARWVKRVGPREL